MQVFNLPKKETDFIDRECGEVVCDNCGKHPIYGCFGESEVYLCKTCAVQFARKNLTLEQVIETRSLNNQRNK